MEADAGAGEIAQRVRAQNVPPGDLGLIPSPQTAAHNLPSSSSLLAFTDTVHT